MSYIPPHLRKLKNNTEKDKVILECNEFPELDKNNRCLDSSLNSKISYLSIIEKKKEKNEEITEVKEGWCIIKKDKKSNKIMIMNSNKNENKLNELDEKKNSLRKLDKMFDNWNKFRDKDIELRGDLSEYDNYKIKIENMREENIRIEEEIYEYYNEIDNMSNASDEEY